MNATSRLIAAFLGILILVVSESNLAADKTVPPTPNGIQLPKGFRYWQLIGVSHREDNQSLRAILGNGIAVNAARKGMTNPWPKGTILAKLVWKDRTHENWEKAIVPGELVHAEFIVKDTNRFKSTGGWGFARWKGIELTPFGDDASFAEECFSCHGAAKETDHVFTRPVQIP